MGGKCCHDSRKDGQGPTKDTRKSVHNAYGSGSKRAISIGYQSKGDDADKFDKAFADNDLKAFVQLLSSEQPIEKFDERMHPWAEDPKTVGALAGTQLAILASAEDNGGVGIKDEIRKAGAIPPLVDFLKSKEEDRQQTAVVALSFLTADCTENTVQAYEAGALPLLKDHCKSTVAGMKAAAATTLRNICMENDKYREEFAVQLDGIKDLVAQLAAPKDDSLNHADVLLEAVLNLQDIIETGDDDGALVPRYAELALKAGAEKELQALTKNEDEEVATSAKEVLDSLQDFKQSGKA